MQKGAVSLFLFTCFLLLFALAEVKKPPQDRVDRKIAATVKTKKPLK